METLTGKRRGRPRKAVDLPPAIAEGEEATRIHDGNGQAGGTGPSAPALDPEPGSEWDRFVEDMTAVINKLPFEHVNYATYPEKEGIIRAQHTVPVKLGPRGWSDKDGNWQPF